MTTKPNDGGPAFPREGHYGMTLRDYFAAEAMHSFCGELNMRNLHAATAIAGWAYAMADEMLKARQA